MIRLLTLGMGDARRRKVEFLEGLAGGTMISNIVEALGNSFQGFDKPIDVFG